MATVFFLIGFVGLNVPQARAECPALGVIPRDVLLLTDGLSPAGFHLTRLRNRLRGEGLVLRTRSLDDVLDETPDRASLAGVITWFHGPVPQARRVGSWLGELMSGCDSRLPRLAIGHPGHHTRAEGRLLLRQLGLVDSGTRVIYSGQPAPVAAGWVKDGAYRLSAGVYPGYAETGGSEALLSVDDPLGRRSVVMAAGSDSLYLSFAAFDAVETLPDEVFALFRHAGAMPETGYASGRRTAAVMIGTEGWSAREGAAGSGAIGETAHDILMRLSPLSAMPVSVTDDADDMANDLGTGSDQMAFEAFIGRPNVTRAVDPLADPDVPAPLQVVDARPGWADTSGLVGWGEALDRQDALLPMALRFVPADMLSFARRRAVEIALDRLGRDDVAVLSLDQIRSAETAYARTQITQTSDGTWTLTDSAGLMSVRLPKGRAIDVEASSGVFGAAVGSDGFVHVHLDPSASEHVIATRPSSTDAALVVGQRPALVTSGAVFSQMKATACSVRALVSGGSPGTARWQVAPGTTVQLSIGADQQSIEAVDGSIVFDLPATFDQALTVEITAC